MARATPRNGDFVSHLRSTRARYIVGDADTPTHVAGELYSECILNREEYDKIVSKDTGYDISRALVDSVIRKGNVASDRFMTVWTLYTNRTCIISSSDILEYLEEFTDVQLRTFIFHMKSMANVNLTGCENMLRVEIAEMFPQYFGKRSVSTLIDIMRRAHRNDLAARMEDRFGNTPQMSTGAAASLSHNPLKSGASTRKVMIKAERDDKSERDDTEIVGEVLRQLTNKDMRLFVMNLTNSQSANVSYADIVFETLSAIGRTDVAQMIIYKLGQ